MATKFETETDLVIAGCCPAESPCSFHTTGVMPERAERERSAKEKIEHNVRQLKARASEMKTRARKSSQSRLNEIKRKGGQVKETLATNPVLLTAAATAGGLMLGLAGRFVKWRLERTMRVLVLKEHRVEHRYV